MAMHTKGDPAGNLRQISMKMATKISTTVYRTDLSRQSANEHSIGIPDAMNICGMVLQTGKGVMKIKIINSTNAKLLSILKVEI